MHNNEFSVFRFVYNNHIYINNNHNHHFVLYMYVLIIVIIIIFCFNSKLYMYYLVVIYYFIFRFTFRFPYKKMLYVLLLFLLFSLCQLRRFQKNIHMRFWGKKSRRRNAHRFKFIFFILKRFLKESLKFFLIRGIFGGFSIPKYNICICVVNFCSVCPICFSSVYFFYC